MKTILIEEVSNGWIVREPELLQYPGQPYQLPQPPFVYQRIEDLQNALPDLLGPIDDHRHAPC